MPNSNLHLDGAIFDRASGKSVPVSDLVNTRFGKLLSSAESVSQLKSIETAHISDKDIVFISGYRSGSEKGGGFFRWDESSTEAENGGTVFESNDGRGAWVRLYSGPVSVFWFGAYGDGISDDTSALQAAADLGIPCDCTGGVFGVSDTINIPNPGFKLFAQHAQRPSDNPNKTAKFVYLDVTIDPMFRVRQADTIFENIGIYGQGRAVTAGTAILFQRSPGQPNDIDGRLRGCEIGDVGTAVRIVGRGLHVKESTMSGCGTAIVLDWPTDGTNPGGTLDTIETGARGYQFSDLFFHGNDTGITNEGYNAQNIRAINAVNIMCDTGGAEGHIFLGVAVESVFTNCVSNISTVAASLALKLLPGSRKTQFVNCYMGGFQSADTTRLPRNLVRIESNSNYPVKDLKFIGCSFGPCNRDGVQLVTQDGAAASFLDIVFIACSWERCGLEASGYAPISILSNGASTIGSTSIKFGACTFYLDGTNPGTVIGGDNVNTINVYRDLLTGKSGATAEWAKSNVTQYS